MELIQDVLSALMIHPAIFLSVAQGGVFFTVLWKILEDADELDELEELSSLECFLSAGFLYDPDTEPPKDKVIDAIRIPKKGINDGCLKKFFQYRRIYSTLQDFLYSAHSR